MVTSQGSMPPAQTAAPISRSPLLPSSRMTATRTFPVACRGGNTFDHCCPTLLLQYEGLAAAPPPRLLLCPPSLLHAGVAQGSYSRLEMLLHMEAAIPSRLSHARHPCRQGVGQCSCTSALEGPGRDSDVGTFRHVTRATPCLICALQGSTFLVAWTTHLW